MRAINTNGDVSQYTAWESFVTDSLQVPPRPVNLAINAAGDVTWESGTDCSIEDETYQVKKNSYLL